MNTKLLEKKMENISPFELKNRVISTAKIRNKHPDISKNTAVILQNLTRN